MKKSIMMITALVMFATMGSVYATTQATQLPNQPQAKFAEPRQTHRPKHSMTKNKTHKKVEKSEKTTHTPAR